MATAAELVTLIKYKLDETGLRRYERESKRAADGVEKSGQKAWKKWGDGTKNAGEEVGALTSRLKVLAGALLGIASVGAILKSAGELAQLDEQLKRTITSSKEYEAVQQRLFGLAQEYTIPVSDVRETFLQLRQTLSETGIQTKQQLDLFEALQSSMAASGTSTSRASQLMRRFSRNMAEGALGSSTIQTFIDGNIVGLQALVKGLQKTAPELNATTKNIRKLVQEGKLTSDIVLPALTSQLGDLREKAGEMTTSLDDAMVHLRNSFTEIIRGSDSAKGALGVVTRSIIWLSRNLGMVITIAGSIFGAFAFSKILAGLKSIIATVRSVAIAIGIGFGPLAVVAAVIAAIVIAIQDVWTWLKGGDSVLGDLVGSTNEWQSELDDIIKPAKKIWEYLQEYGKFLSDIVASVANWAADVVGLQGGFKDLAGVVKGVFGAVLNGIATTLEGIVSTIRWAKNAAGSVSNWAGNAGNAISGAAGSAWDFVKSPFVGSSTSATDNSTHSTEINITTNSDSPQAIGNAVKNVLPKYNPVLLPSVEAQ